MSPPPSGQVLDRSNGGGLADVVELILDKGLVIDVFARISVIGIEIITVEIRVVVASIDTYLRYADAMQQLALTPRQPAGLTDLTREAGRVTAAGKTKGAIDGVTEKVSEMTPSAARRSSRQRN